MVCFDSKKELEKTKALLGLVQDTYARLEQLFQAMAKAKAGEEAVLAYLKEVFLDPQDTDDPKAVKRTLNRRKCALYLFHHGQGNEDADVRTTESGGDVK